MSLYILTDEVVGEQATIMFNEAQSMIKEIIAKQLLKPKAILICTKQILK